MKLKNKFISLFICFLAIFSFSGCNSGAKDESYYTNIAQENVRTILNNNSIAYQSISSKYWFSGNVLGDIYKYFYILIEFENQTSNQTIFDSLKLVENTFTNDSENDRAKFLYDFKGVCNNQEYKLQSSSSSYGYIDELVCSYRVVYNSISEKHGIDLTLEERATIYGSYKTYLEMKNSDNSYKYTHDEIRAKLSDKFNITTEYIITQIDCADVWLEYYKGYNK